MLWSIAGTLSMEECFWSSQDGVFRVILLARLSVPLAWLSTLMVFKLLGIRICCQFKLCTFDGRRSFGAFSEPKSRPAAVAVQNGRLTWIFFVMFMGACFINECVRSWLWGIHLHQRLRVPPGFPSFPRMPVVMLLQLGAPTLCWCK